MSHLVVSDQAVLAVTRPGVRLALINKFYQNLWKSYQKEKNVFVCQLPGCERVHAGVRRGAVDEGALEQINWNLANWNDRVDLNEYEIESCLGSWY